MTTATAAQPVSLSMVGNPGEMGQQGQALNPLIDGLRAPDARIGLAVVYMDGHHQSFPHRHDRTPMVVCVLDGQAATHYGPSMVARRHGAGPMVYVPAGLEHAASNQGPHRLTALEARLISPRSYFDDDTTKLPDLQQNLDKANTVFARPPSTPDPGPRPTLVEAQGDRHGYGLVPVVHSGSVPGAKMSAARMMLPPHRLWQPGTIDYSVEPARVHSRAQRIIVVLRGTLAVICGDPARPYTAATLCRNDVLWLPEQTPYVLANVGSNDVIGMVFSTDPTFNGDSEPVVELDESAKEIAPRLRQRGQGPPA